jgi:hypothetical protein
MPWDAITSIATVISTVAFILTALYVRAELKALEKDRYLAITSELFSLWESKEFMESQLWLLHRMQESNWTDFVRSHRADLGESAFHRVGSFYDRVGTLVRLRLVNKDEILVTIGPHAIAVWSKIRGLVEEARRIEHSTLFADFERLLPSCRECYVPSLGPEGRVHPFSLSQPALRQVPRIERAEVKSRLDRGDSLGIVDVRRPEQVDAEPRGLPNAVWLPPENAAKRLDELPRDREIIVYCA